MTESAPHPDAPPALDSLVEARRMVETKTAPRVTEEAIRSKIAAVEYLTHDTTTICFITMRNGWRSMGTSTPASAENYDAEIGRRYAYDQAFRPLWQLEGYLLRETLHRGETA